MFKIVKREEMSEGNVILNEIEAPKIARKAQPGQFVILKANEDGERIPLTMAETDADKGTITIIYMVVGNGDKKYGDYIEDLGDKYKIKVIKVDGVSNKNLPAYYSASDLAVWPVEATIGTIEAMACSLPIICNKDLNERYEKGNGFGVNPGNIEELAEKLDFFIQNSLKTAQMGDLSKRVVIENLSWRIIAEKFLE